MKKNLIVIVATFALTALTVNAAPITVSVQGNFITFQKEGSSKAFMAKVDKPQELAAVYIIYPKRDFSEYVLGPNLYAIHLNHAERRADEKEWKRLEGEWKQIVKTVSFSGISGEVSVDTSRKYTLVGTALGSTQDLPNLLLTFKVTYVNTGKEGVEVIPWERFKIRPEEGKTFLMGTDNGMYVPVFEQNGEHLVKVN